MKYRDLHAILRQPLLAILQPLLLLSCTSQAIVQAPTKAPGTIILLDAGEAEGETGWWPSIVFDSKDTPHIAYCDRYHGDLIYVTKIKALSATHHIPTKWRKERLISAGAVGKYSSIAVDNNDLVAIAYYDQDQKHLRFTYQTKPGRVTKGSHWINERVAWGLESGMAAKLLFDHSNTAHLFYYITRGKFIHAKRISADNWEREVIDITNGSWNVRISPVLHKDDIWVSYVHWNFKDTDLRLAHFNPLKPLKQPRQLFIHTGKNASKEEGTSKFSLQVVAKNFGPGWRSQLFLNAGNNGVQPIIFYTMSLKTELRQVVFNGESFKTQMILPKVGNMAAAQSADGDIFLAVEDITGGRAGRGALHYLKQSIQTDKGTTQRQQVPWQRFVVDKQGPTGEHLAIAVNSLGKPIIVYYSREIRGLKVYDETE